MSGSWLAEAPGKLVLIGEYAVLVSFPALVLAVDRRARVRFSEDDDWVVDPAQWAIGEVRLELHGADSLREQLPASLALVGEVLEALRPLLVSLPPLHLELDTSELVSGKRGPKLGLGSSAALATALVAGLHALAGQTIAAADLQSIVHAAHRRAQGGLGSGIDVAAACLGGCLRYQLRGTGGKDLSPRQVHLPAGFHWQAVWSGRSASTPRLLLQVADLARRHPRRHEALLSRLGTISQQAISELGAGDATAFRALVRDFLGALDDLGDAAGADIVSAPHREMADIVTSAGGAYKPSGAGGGDLGLVFARTPGELRETVESLARAGYPAVPMALAEDGVRCRQS